ncbi:MAG: hypothetical protein ACI9TF_000283 [Paracrocinitomix sp.]|jgi:hypothetical protein
MFGMKVKSPREALVELSGAGQLDMTDEDIAAIREVTSGSRLAEELYELVLADG